MADRDASKDVAERLRAYRFRPEGSPRWTEWRIEGVAPSPETGMEVESVDFVRADLIDSQAATIARLTEERDALRKALIETGRAVGGGLADGVSSAFLMHVPNEVRLVTARAEANLAKAVEALEPFVAAYKQHDDPGVSDLYDEQPVAWHVPLGAYRRARSIAAAIRSLKEKSGE